MDAKLKSWLTEIGLSFEEREDGNVLVRMPVLVEDTKWLPVKDMSPELRAELDKDILERQAEPLKGGEELLAATITTNRVDRYRDIVEPKGARLADFRKNPVVLWAHNASFSIAEPPIGTAVKLEVKDDRINALIRFSRVTERALEVSALYREGTLRAFSIGFIPGTGKGDVELRMEGEEVIGLRFKRWDLLEFSAVPVPANPDALVNSFKARGMKVTDEVFEQMLGAMENEDAEHVLREVGGVGAVVQPAPKAAEGEGDPDPEPKPEGEGEEPKPEEQDAQDQADDEGDTKPEGDGDEEVTVDGTAVDEDEAGEKAAATVEERMVVPFKSYPLAPEETAWNGPRERREADIPTLKLISTWFDSEDAEVKGSYKLLHHRASDKNTIWRGVSAAMGVLLGARGGVDIPDGDRRGVYNHLVKHYEEFEKEAPEFRGYSAEELADLYASFFGITPGDISRGVSVVGSFMWACSEMGWTRGNLESFLRAGRVLSEKNFGKLSKASELLAEVLESAAKKPKPEDGDGDEEADKSVDADELVLDDEADKLVDELRADMGRLVEDRDHWKAEAKKAFGERDKARAQARFAREIIADSMGAAARAREEDEEDVLELDEPEPDLKATETKAAESAEDEVSLENLTVEEVRTEVRGAIGEQTGNAVQKEIDRQRGRLPKDS